MGVVRRYGIHMMGGWSIGDSSEECRLRVVRQRDREKEPQQPALWGLEKLSRKLEWPQACTGGYS